jgi:2-oxo-4-hydroxy-4-carboxy-5-ureidoimidazoline decarboxylase
MSDPLPLESWNALSPDAAATEILPCCGSNAWARAMATRRPIPNESLLLAACDEVWWGLPESAWMEAFQSHPRIGESRAHQTVSARSAEWSGDEQRTVAAASDDIKFVLAEANREYEARFHRIFIVCATGKSPEQILQTLRQRLRNDDTTELREAAEQQRQITHLRLKKWLAS